MKRTSIFFAILSTLIEVFDFSIFPLLIPVLSEVYFSAHDKAIAVNFTILAFFVSYLVKPVGALVFGLLMDKYGRKSILIATTLLMILATSTIGFLPVSFMGWGMGAGLIVCRIIQGLSMSGEFPSAIIMSVEQGKKNHGFTGSLAFMGGSIGLLFANVSIYLLLDSFTHEQLIEFAWRIPFLMSLLGSFILLFLRSRLPDYDPASNPSGYRSLLGTQKSRLLSVFVVSGLSASAFYITFVHMPTWLSSMLDIHSHQQSLLITLVPLLVYIVALPTGGFLADTIGIMKQIKIASILYLSCSYAVFAWLPHLNAYGCMLVLALYACIQALLNSALPAYIVSGFQTNQRGKALAISYNISLTLFGGLMPYLFLTANNHINPGIPISLCAGLCFLVIYNSRKNYGYLRSESVCG